MRNKSKGRIDKYQRLLLFNNQGGLCYWCKKQMFYTDKHIKYQPNNLCTLDHLYGRFDILRGNLNNGAIQKVAACVECNQRRGKESECRQPLWYLQQRKSIKERHWFLWLEYVYNEMTVYDYLQDN